MDCLEVLAMKSKDKIIIGIDTSCYTTSIAAINLSGKIILNEKILLEVGKNSKGLRQSEAVFSHIKNMDIISDRIRNFLFAYEVVAICASSAPRPIENSYMPVFKVGYNFAKLYSSISGCEFFETTHQENHIQAVLYDVCKNKKYCSQVENLEQFESVDDSFENEKIAQENFDEKFLAVHISGGTTEILLIDENKVQIVGGTKDVSFGQLIDRFGVKVGYKFPCGKFIDANALRYKKILEENSNSMDLQKNERKEKLKVAPTLKEISLISNENKTQSKELALNSNKNETQLKVASTLEESILKNDMKLKISVKDGYMNLSGIENQINKKLEENTGLENIELCSMLLLDALSRNMFKSLIYLCKKYNTNKVVFVGGVSSSKYLKEDLSLLLQGKNIKAYFSKSEFATDNAVGCAVIGLKKTKNK
jgi:N6-L-threonylcarbamoyladenine synthase